MSKSNLTITVRGRPIDTYQGTHPSDRKTYVEGRKGTIYEIRYTNNCNKRRKIVVSVDGLNVTTGDATWERGYWLEPYQVINIPGWRKSDNTTAAFEFSSSKSSYNQHNLSGDERNVGVIGCRVFEEKVQPLPQPQVIHHHNIPYYPWYVYPIYYYPPPYQYPSQYLNLSGSVGPFYSSTTNTVGLQSSGATGASGEGKSLGGAVGSVGSAGGGTSLGGGAGGVGSVSGGAGSLNNFTNSFMNDSLSGGPAAVSCNYMTLTATPAEPLGTAWGKDVAFQTKAVDWISETIPVETIIIYYDSFEGLKRRGVNLISKEYHPVEPQAFPDGCPAPIVR